MGCAGNGNCFRNYSMVHHDELVQKAAIIAEDSKGAFYGRKGGMQFLKQLVGAGFVIGWNVVTTSIILLVIRVLIPLLMSDEELKIGDDAVHGEESYALAGQGQREKSTQNGRIQLHVDSRIPLV
ncbi:ammonium transporter Amt2 [Sarracenia purpurea var. burkii]